MKPLDRLHVYLEETARPGALNMAMDEALLETSEFPLLRFYRWERPSLSFGYFGKFADVAARSDERDIVRRWTGGGIVLHGEDTTYSFILSATHPLFAKPATLIYELLHAAIRNVLCAAGYAAVLAPATAVKISEACFANPARADVMLAGRKIAGAAIRRTRAGLLHQGSIQAEPLAPEFPEQFARALSDGPVQVALDPSVLARAEILAEQKYGTEEWLRRR